MLRRRPDLTGSKDALICGVLAVTAVLGIGGIRGVAAVQAAAVIYVQHQAGGAHSAVLGAGSFALYTALMAFLTVEFLPLSHSVFPHETVGGTDSFY